MKYNLKIDEVSFRLGGKKVSIDDFIEENPSWEKQKILDKTGIKSQYFLENNETPLGLAEEACFGLNKNIFNKIDLLIYVTQAPDYFLPSGSCILQDKLGLSVNTMAMDINLGCSGFVYALSVISSLISTKQASKALLVCADGYSRYIDKHDRTCRPIFSDAASAAIISYNDEAKIGPFIFGTDGSGSSDLIVKGGAIKYPDEDAKIFMAGAKVMLFTLYTVPREINKLLVKANKSLEDISWFIFHQASKTIINGITEKLSIKKDKVITNYQKYGNTVSSTIPICFSECIDNKLFKTGDIILLAGFGVGLSWGLCLIEY